MATQKISTILIVFLTLFMSCSSNDSDPTPTYKDLTGNWVFTGTKISGNLKISKAVDNSYNVESGSVYNIGTNSYTSTNVHKLKISGLTIQDINISNGESDYLNIHTLTYTGDFTKIEGEYVEISECKTVTDCTYEVDETHVYFTRK